MFILRVLFSLIFSTVLLAGCGSEAPEPLTVPFELSLKSAADINPDYQNRPSPLVVRIYQLRHIDAFNNHDFFSLYEKDQQLLAKDLLNREELEIRPGQDLSKPLEINRNSKFLVVLAAYRDLDASQWKAILPIDPINEVKPLLLRLEKNEVFLGPVEQTEE